MTEIYRRNLFPVRGMDVQVNFCPESGRLSIHGSSRHGSGQVAETLLSGKPNEMWTREKCQILYEIWKRWHLNDLRAGTPKQEEAVREWKRMGNKYEYETVVEYLKSINLYVDNGYRYGSNWLKENVPTDVLEWLFSLPGVGACFSDVCLEEIGEDDFNMILNSN